MKYFNPICRVSLSLTFPIKSRCKFCSSKPKYFFFIKQPSAWQDHKIVKYINNWLMCSTEMCSDFYLIEKPSYFNSIKYFSHKLDYKGFNPRFHKNKGYLPEKSIIDYLSCECGKTTWAFNCNSGLNKPEINQKQSSKYYPHKFI